VNFSGSREHVWGANATVMIASEPHKSATEVSNSLFHNPLWVNNPVSTAARKQPLRTSNSVPASSSVANGGKVLTFVQSSEGTQYGHTHVADCPVDADRGYRGSCDSCQRVYHASGNSRKGERERSNLYPAMVVCNLLCSPQENNPKVYDSAKQMRCQDFTGKVNISKDDTPS